MKKVQIYLSPGIQVELFNLSMARRDPLMKKGSFYILQVFIKEFFINGILKSFTPIWIDSDADIANDPYTTDCSGKSTATNPHAFTQFEIINGELTSQNCIEKPPGKPISI